MSTLSSQRAWLRPSHPLVLACGALLVAVAVAFATRGTVSRAASTAPTAARAPRPAAGEPTSPAPAPHTFASDAELAGARTAGLAHAANGDAALALDRLVPVYRARPDDTVAIAIAEASLTKRDFKTAEVVLAALQAPDAPDALRARGMLHEQANKLDEALALYERAIPGLADPFTTRESRARVLSWLGRFDDASAAYAQLAADERASLALRRSCRVRLAELTAWKKDLDGALSQLAALLAEDRKQPDALLMQGQVLEWQGRYAEAKRSYSEVLAFDASNAQARLRLDKLLWVD